MPTLTNTIPYSFGSPSHSNQRRKEIKGIQIGKEEVVPSLFADDMIFYIENPKHTTRKFLELINEYSKVVSLKDIKLKCRNPLHAYTPTMKKQKDKLRKQPHSAL